MMVSRWLVLVLCACLFVPAHALDTSAGKVEVREVLGGLEEPWAVGFLPQGGVIVTQREGRVIIARDGESWEVAGGPEVSAIGQGGLLDVMVPRDFEQSRELFFSYAKPQSQDAGTALAVALLAQDEKSLLQLRDLFVLRAGSSGGRHFGSRIVEGRDGHLFMTIGDRGARPSAQDLRNENGTVVRLNRDGTIPDDNPFFEQGDARGAIWSYGHRNAQGAALDGNGELWLVEHGARGGDEVNVIRKGANYGWPVISYGRHYSGAKIGEGTQKEGMAQPEFYWDPSIAPSGMMIYSGKLWPEWADDIFVGSLKFDMISRLEGAPLSEVERIASPETRRIRDIREAPDGSIFFLSVGQGALYQMTQAPAR